MECKGQSAPPVLGSLSSLGTPAAAQQKLEDPATYPHHMSGL